jgi:hypothetical protein
LIVILQALIVLLNPEDVESGGERPVEEIRLGEAQIDRLYIARQRAVQAQILAATQQIALVDAELPSRPSVVEKPVPTLSSPVDCSSTLTLTTVLSGALPCDVGFDLLEEAEILQVLLGPLDLRGVEGVALGQRNSRRMTRSSVRTLPLTSIRST